MNICEENLLFMFDSLLLEKNNPHSQSIKRFNIHSVLDPPTP